MARPKPIAVPDERATLSAPSPRPSESVPGGDPVLITGGMGVRISWWKLARIVSMMQGLGVVSGTALEVVHARSLQDGDPEGHLRRAYAELARRHPALAKPLARLVEKYFIEGGRRPDAPYKPVPVWRLDRVEEATRGADTFWQPSLELQVLTVAANFAEVWLAKEGHPGKVGINYLRKIERPLPWALYGAVLGGADYVIVGAGSPPEIPGMLRSLAGHEPTSLALKVFGATSASGTFSVLNRPRLCMGEPGPALPPPKFLAIVASFDLARALASDPATRPYGFVIEGPEAGGHSAPPAKKSFDARGRVVLHYTDGDRADIGAIAGLGLPFWLAGSYASPGRLREARDLGAAGIQVGTIAALSGQSGMSPELRDKILDLVKAGELSVAADGTVSPTGFPFKVARVPGTLSEESVYLARKRVCDVAQLQSAYLTADGRLDFRCPAEPVADFVRKGGREKNTEGRVCLCNGLLATGGLAQVRPDGYVEPPIVTLGEDLDSVRKLQSTLAAGQETYAIGKALRYVRNPA